MISSFTFDKSWTSFINPIADKHMECVNYRKIIGSCSYIQYLLKNFSFIKFSIINALLLCLVTLLFIWKIHKNYTFISSKHNITRVITIKMSWVVLQELEGKQMLVQLRGKLKVGKQLVQVASGIEFNKLYKIVNGFPEAVQQETQSIQGPITGNNKDFFDNNTAQSLNHNQILEIRTQQGGEALIDQLVQNSSTFTMKSQFAQEKYIKKKKNK